MKIILQNDCKMTEISEKEDVTIEEMKVVEEWKSYPEFSNNLFSNTERVMKGDKEIKVQ